MSVGACRPLCVLLYLRKRTDLTIIVMRVLCIVFSVRHCSYNNRVYSLLNLPWNVVTRVNEKKASLKIFMAHSHLQITMVFLEQ